MARAMKQSGIEWLGEIPTDWKIQRGKNILTILERTVKDDDGIITCFRNGEVTLRSNRREDGFTMSDKEIGYQGIEVGDLVVHGMDGFAGATGISDSRGKATPVLNVMDSSQNKRYLMYYLRCAAYCGLFLSLSTGIRVRSCDTNWNKLKNVMYLLPPLDEQQRIATFLDGECARIDSVIEKTRASIEEYKKLKQAVITRAVTKGIRPARTMKDSGIEWLGEIPADWKIIPMKYLCSYNDEVLQENTDADFTFDYIEIGSVEFGKGIIEMQRVRFADAPSRARRIVKENDIVVSTVRTYLKAVAQIPNSEVPLIASTGFVVIRPRNVNHVFLKYAILSNVIISMIESNSVGISYPAINAFQVVRFKVPVSPLDEQREIAQYLDEKTAAIDLLIAKKNQLVTELASLKKSLIFEYVTGKKAVQL